MGLRNRHFFRGLKISGKIFFRRHELSRDSRESILRVVLSKFILMVFSGVDSHLFFIYFYLLIYFRFCYYYWNIFRGLFCARLDWDYLCPELLGVLHYVGPSVPKILRGDFSPKWDHLCPRYSGMIFPPEWDHLCPRYLGMIFHPSGTICAQNVDFTWKKVLLWRGYLANFMIVFTTRMPLIRSRWGAWNSTKVLSRRVHRPNTFYDLAVIIQT